MSRARFHAVTEGLPGPRALAEGADHLDVKTVEGRASLEEFLGGMLAWRPGWLRFLYRVRGGFVRLLGMRQNGNPAEGRAPAGKDAFVPGARVPPFTVVEADRDRYVAVVVAESHLTAHLVVVAEPGRFHVATVVHYHRWTGPVYFAVIRPFHHLVVRAMARAGVRGGRPS
ncbi:DUF2867 domain-containing protein [Streptosporangium saharense]|uniref:DUF2867 domain-containing protein n=1 Tax=Streptosporangium saharense TaxID=1706840 RepID=A0A7W7VNS5_9ACTN|nr:DUF2867 domain-containing protein [Streptosporangium saharense]MBB4917142.1 hypothetical protein [Streptosporangium saharense]